MNADVFAEWFRQQGHRVVRTSSSYWYDVGPRVYQAFPYHWVIQPAEGELREFIKREGALALRYSTAVTNTIGQLSYHVAYANSKYDYSSMHKKARYDVQKGLTFAEVEPISFSKLAVEGWTLEQDTRSRQNRSGAESPERWRHLCLSAGGLPGFEAWGALHEGQLVASLLAFTLDDCCSILYQQSLTAHIKWGINHALLYAFTREALSRPNVSWIFYGLHSLDAPPIGNEFKFRMGYIPKPVRQRVVFHPWLSPLFNSASLAIVRQLSCWKPSQPALAKAEGMIRFYLNGKLSPEKQSVPDRLRQRLDALKIH